MKKFLALFVVLLFAVSAFAYTEEFSLKAGEHIELPSFHIVDFMMSLDEDTVHVNVFDDKNGVEETDIDVGKPRLFLGKVYLEITEMIPEADDFIISGVVVSPDFPDDGLGTPLEGKISHFLHPKWNLIHTNIRDIEDITCTSIGGFFVFDPDTQTYVGSDDYYTKGGTGTTAEYMANHPEVKNSAMWIYVKDDLPCYLRYNKDIQNDDPAQYKQKWNFRGVAKNNRGRRVDATAKGGCFGQLTRAYYFDPIAHSNGEQPWIKIGKIEGTSNTGIAVDIGTGIVVNSDAECNMGGSCDGDVDCDPEQICENNLCIIGCRTDDTCAQDEICENNNCVPEECQVNTDCNTGEYCENRRCVSGCSTDPDCAADEICEDNLCILGCRTDPDCLVADEICKGILCVKGCRVDGDCLVGETCSASNNCVSAGPKFEDIAIPYYCCSLDMGQSRSPKRACNINTEIFCPWTVWAAPMQTGPDSCDEDNCDNFCQISSFSRGAVGGQDISITDPWIGSGLIRGKKECICYGQSFSDDFEYNNFPLNGWIVDEATIPGADIYITLKNGGIKLQAPQSAYAHIERNVPIRGQYLQAIIKMRYTGDRPGSSWAPGLTFYWNENQWARVGLGRWYSGLTVELFEKYGATKTGYHHKYLNLGQNDGAWVWLKIKLGVNKIDGYYSMTNPAGHIPPDDWKLIGSFNRESGLQMNPGKVIIGKGYSGQANKNYANADLDNNYNTKTDHITVAYADDFSIEPADLTE